MRKVFLSHSFAERDRLLVTQVDTLMRSHGLIPTNGRTLGGGPLTQEIIQFIKDGDALVALVTLRENDPHNVTHPWVLQELAQARGFDKPAIAIYEKGLPIEAVRAADTGHEYILYDPAAPVDGILRLSETLGEWKRRAGRLFKVLVMPEEVARSLGPKADQVRCECRFHSEGTDTEWRPVKVRREAGGVFVSLRIPESVDMVQIRCDGPPSYESAYTPIFMPVQFEPRQ